MFCSTTYLTTYLPTYLVPGVGYYVTNPSKLVDFINVTNVCAKIIEKDENIIMWAGLTNCLPDYSATRFRPKVAQILKKLPKKWHGSFYSNLMLFKIAQNSTIIWAIFW